MKKPFKLPLMMKIGIASFILNLLLGSFKLLAGYFLDSSAYYSDAFHSFTDVIGTVIALFAVYIGRIPASKKFPYGHEKVGSLIGLVMSFIFALMTGFLAYEAIINLINYDYSSKVHLIIDFKFYFGLVVVILSLILKELMYHIIMRGGKKLNSVALMADAWHQRIDALSSLGALFGLLGMVFGFGFFNDIATLIIVAILLHVVYELAHDSVIEILDHSLPSKELNEIELIIKEESSFELVSLKSRISGTSFFLDVVLNSQGKDYSTISIKNGLIEKIKKNHDTLKDLILEIV